MVFEGETDLITAASWMLDPSEVVPSGDTSEITRSQTWRYLAAPGASWRPGSGMAMSIGLRRGVRLAFDNDDAGEAATKELYATFCNVNGCEVEQWAWDDQAKEQFSDIGDLGAKTFGEKFNCNWVKLN